jgi:hypothetical protein
MESFLVLARSRTTSESMPKEILSFLNSAETKKEIKTELMKWQKDDKFGELLEIKSTSILALLPGSEKFPDAINPPR